MAQGSTQQFLEITDIKEGVLVLRDGGVRGVMLVSSQNFALKSEEEQEAIIYQFQSFLNSLDFSVQITLQSRALNITGYIDYLKDLETKQESDLLRQQTADYRVFVEELIQGGSIMAKNFFVSIPFSWGETRSDAGSNVFRKPQGAGSISDEQFQRMKNQLWQRMEFVALGLRRCGLQIAVLDTEELVELFWNWHHPKESEVGYYPQLPPEVLQ